MKLRRIVALACALSGGALLAAPAFAAPEAATVVVIPIHGTIDEGMAHVVQRSVREAQVAHARAIVLDIDTFGGLVSAATEMRDALLDADVPVDAYVSERAWSAGALVTLSADRIVMAPASSIGAAEPIPKTVKTVSALRGEFETTATRRHRDPTVAGAMVDANINAPGFKAPGAILTLTADQAQRAHFIDAVAPSLRAALRGWGLGDAHSTTAQYTFGETLARFATDPNVSGLLLSLGFLGLLIEMQTLHGIAGLVGITALAIFFGTHVYAGFSNSLVIGLAVVGLLGILLELHVLPGHGFAGILGAVALIASVLLAFGIAFFFVAIQAVAIAIVVTAILFTISSRIFPENAFIRRLAFVGAQGPDYVASLDHRALIGRSGQASSYLRPAGVATIDGVRVDVLTEGDFVSAGTAVRVTRVEGARIFVRPEEA